MDEPDLLAMLRGEDGRGEYQVQSLLAAMKRGTSLYASSRSLHGFALPLFADVGTGKTPSTLVYHYLVTKFLREQGDSRADMPSLIVVPATVKVNWLEEVHKWRPDIGLLDTWIVTGDEDYRRKQVKALKALASIGEAPKLIIINYDLLRIHQQDYQNLDPDGHNPIFLMLVCDEAHYIKHRDSARSQAVMSVTAHIHCSLTGTPQTNKPDSLHNVLTWLDNTPTLDQRRREQPPRPKSGHCPLTSYDYTRIVNIGQGCLACRFWARTKEECVHHRRKDKCWTDAVPGRTMRYRRASPQWGSLENFTWRYCEMDCNQYGCRPVGPKMSMMPELHRRLENIGMIRWRRAEVLKLKPIDYEHVILDATDAQVSLYNQLVAGFVRVWSEHGDYLGAMQIRNILAQLTYFRRATTLTPAEFNLALAGSNPSFAPHLRIPVEDKGAKQQWLLDLVDSQIVGNGDKLLVFSDWTDVLRPMLVRLEKLGLDKRQFDIIDGSVNNATRQAISTRWNSDPDFKVLLGSPAMFEGINLQGGLSSDSTMYVAILNMPWMPHQVIQAIGRAWRFGQEGSVVALFPSLRDTIDERMTAVLFSKQAGFDSAIDGDQMEMAKIFEPSSKRQMLDLVGTGIKERK